MPSQSKSNSSEVAPVHTTVTSLRDPGLQCHSSSTKSPLKHSHCSRVIVSGKQCLNIKTNIHKHSCDNIGMFQIYQYYLHIQHRSSFLIVCLLLDYYLIKSNMLWPRPARPKSVSRSGSVPRVPPCKSKRRTNRRLLQ